MKKQIKAQYPKIYFVLLLILGIVIIFESVLIVKTLRFREKTPQLQPPIVKKIIPTIEAKKGSMKVLLEENQKVISNKDLKAKIVFDSQDEQIGGVDAILVFDPKAISVVNISGNKEIFEQIIVNTQKQKEGEIKITAYQPKKEIRNAQVLASLTLRLLQNKPASLKIKFLGPDVSTDSNLIAQKTQKDILENTQSINLIPEGK